MTQQRRGGTRGGTTTRTRSRVAGAGAGAWDCAAGAAVGLVGLLRLASLASLVFAGRLAGHLQEGLALFLLGGAAMMAVVAWRGSHPRNVSPPQDAPCVVLGLAGAGVVAGPWWTSTAYHSLVVVIVLAALSTALCMLLLGWLRLGRVVRLVPLPLVIGFLAGIAVMMALAALGLAVDRQLSWSGLVELVQPDARWRLLVALGLTAFFVLTTRLWRSPLALPCALLVALVGFGAVCFLLEDGVERARAAGWFMSAPTSPAAWPRPWESFEHAHWPLIRRELPVLLLVPAACLAAMLLNTRALARQAEAESDRLDLDRELRAAGLGNLLGAAGGSVPGFASLSLTRLGEQLGGRGRLVGVSAAAVTLLALVLGTGWLAWLPRPVVAALLLSIAADLFFRQVWDRRAEWLRWRSALALLVCAALLAVLLLAGLGLGWWRWEDLAAPGA